MGNTEAVDIFDPTTQPSPDGGWSEQIMTLQGATIVPPLESSFVQAAGVLDADGEYCPQGALWRKYRPLTIEPVRPDEVTETLTGRWLWGGVLWVHFGHFLVESTSRLWALDALDRPVDGIVFMPKRPRVGQEVRGFHQDFIHMMAPGLQIRAVAVPTRVEELVVPGQGFGLGRITSGTPRYRDAIHNIFAKYIKADGPEKIYISRSALGLSKGGLLGEERLEAQLQDEGYDIFHPQKFDLKTQIARYKAAKMIVAADGSALHLFAMVGRPDQRVAMVMRRKSSANNLLASNVAHFCGCNPLIIGALRTEWVKASKKKSNRQSFGELNLKVIGRALHDGGFVKNGDDWPDLTDDERLAIFAEKGLVDNDQFVESPEFVRARVKVIRQARRARHESSAE